VKTVSTLKEIRALVDRWHRNGKTVGLVPTMGALHEGHLHLVRAARQACDRVVVSLFVNPTQFSAGEDFAKYPRDLKKDTRLVAAEKADVIFAPTAEEMYPAGFDTSVTVGPALTQTMCGLSRPNHFQGVATVVMKLLNLMRPQQAFFGQKDYQQTLVVKRIAADLNTGCDIVVLPTVREADGLAKSSRNAYLSEEERRLAPSVYQALKLADGILQVGERNPKELLDAVRKRLKTESKIEIEYVAAKNAETLEDLLILSGRVLVAVAVKLGSTRLIDNIVVDVPTGS
jgi:pantoate--beta-alanine ligase